MHVFSHSRRVEVKKIDVDDYFRISRNYLNPDLVTSIKNFGLLEKPCLIKRGERYYPFTCHNRIKIISGMDVNEIEAFILDKPLYDIFAASVILKVYRGECGPVGRVKAAEIIRRDFGITGSRFADFVKKNLKIPHEIFSDAAVIDRILSLPSALSDYIDQKDITYKVIRDIISSGDEGIDVLNMWVENIQVRVNIFKMLVDYLFDIKKRDGGLLQINTAEVPVSDDRGLHDYIFKIRYPEYAFKKEAAGRIISILEKHGVSVGFPEYFEKNNIAFTFNITKKDGGRKLSEIVSALNTEKIDELLDFL